MAEGIKTIAENRRARHDYHIEETHEAGIVLVGTEVKSLRQGRANLTDSYAAVENGELFLYNMHISPYSHGNMFNHEPRRTRKLLMHKREIVRLLGQTQQRGFTLVPLRIYFRRGRAKIELGLAKGKRLYDKREAIARRDERRRIDRALKEHNR
ncbi:MAG: SsrA-binding protein SmpB [Firmicutes bacterium]|nr:SsrA-binding protein SmpB [Bacillota bacterium]